MSLSILRLYLSQQVPTKFIVTLQVLTTCIWYLLGKGSNGVSLVALANTVTGSLPTHWLLLTLYMLQQRNKLII